MDGTGNREVAMKREASFFKDRRATSGKALLAAMRAVGMSDAEIIEALKAAQQKRETDDLSVCLCPADGMPNAFCPLHGVVASGHGLR